MKNKIIYIIAICIIIAGAAVIATIGLNVDVTYSKNVRIDVYLGKTFDNNEMKQIVQEVFGNGRTIVQKIEYYEDMASITIKRENAENMKEKLEQFNNKINEKYELENKVDDMNVTYQPKVKLFSLLKPYLLPIAITSLIVIVYASIRFRKMGVVATIISYLVAILASEGVYLSLLAITRIPINRLVIPVGLAIYAVVITLVTALQEKKYAKHLQTEKQK